MISARAHLLVINGGSSSIKFTLFEWDAALREVLHGSIERIGLPSGTFHVGGAGEVNSLSRRVVVRTQAAAVELLIDWLAGEGARWNVRAVGHRIVHGGPRFFRPKRITVRLIADLRRLVPLDPVHLPGQILLASALRRRFPRLPQVACFDTAFHHRLPAVARLLPIPRKYQARGVRRYGFHGLSCESLIGQLRHVAGPQAARGRVILAHLGNGASLTAVRNGKSVDTTMGLTPTGGVPMSTRSGDLDPGLAWYLARTDGVDPRRFNEMVNFKAGLLGLSGTSSDMRDLLKRQSRDRRAAEAVEFFCYEVRKRLGAFAAALGGCDTIIFAGGIGEHAPAVRSRICAELEFLGVALDPKRNLANRPVISRRGSPVVVRVMHTDEERVMARALRRNLKTDPSRKA